MANGTYGTKRPALVTADDVEIFYNYKPSYGSDSVNGNVYQRLEGVFSAAEGQYEDNEQLVLPGMYNLRLPLSIFNKKGIYTVYIKPKEIFLTLADADARLAAYPNIRGIVIDSGSLGTGNQLSGNGNLIGYRVEYFGDDGTNRTGEYRIITSNNKCEPVHQNFTDSSQKGVRYRFNDSSNLIFCTLTPSTSLSFKSDSVFNVGKVGQRVALVNTKFNPVALEIEMTDHDIESISTMLEGSQIRNLDKGIITTFNKNGDIYHQAVYGNITKANEEINHDFKLVSNDKIEFSEKGKFDKIEKNAR